MQTDTLKIFLDFVAKHKQEILKENGAIDTQGKNGKRIVAQNKRKKHSFG